MVDIKKREVKVKDLRWECDPSTFSFETTEDIDPLEGIIGQERAMVALKTGLGIEAPGYNIFVSGLTGTGRTITIKKTLERFLESSVSDDANLSPDDICYVHNFTNPDMPGAITLPAGDGERFRKAMADMVLMLKTTIPRVLTSQDFKNRVKNVAEEFRNKQKDLINRLKLKSQEEGFSLVQIDVGGIPRTALMPNFQNQPTPLEKLEGMVVEGEFPRERFEELKEKSFLLNSELDNTQRASVEIEKELRKKVEELETDGVRSIIESQIESVRSVFSHEKIASYLDDVKVDILENISFFKMEEMPQVPQLPFPMMGMMQEKSPLWRYEVNLLVDNRGTKGRPVIIETSPSHNNLFGNIERSIDRSGALHTDFTKLKAGSLHRANGGYLIINAYDLLIEPAGWHCLKRVLKNKKLEFQCIEPMYLFSSLSIKPEPIDANVKVIMVGEPYMYQMLLNRDDDFQMIFKVKSDFDPVMLKNEEHIKNYASFVKKITDEDGLLPFDRGAMAQVVEYGVREARSQKKMSTKLSDIADIIREASYWATADGKDVVGWSHVDRTIKEKIKRVNMVEDKIKERIREGTVMIETEGKVVGQVNGLGVYNLGNHTFGAPSKITAVTSLGRSGVINIEREAKLSGNVYNKGVLILTGFLRGKYAQDVPLTLSASITFEQSYSGVDGDSASSTEVYAIISSITGIGLRQDVAVTGSVNQKGEIQPIGGVNDKIEGFFDVCRDRELTGTQGVMVPLSNVEELMLRPDVVDAVKDGKFHVYGVSTIDEGIEILTNMEAGEMKDDGTYADGTINYMVIKRLKDLHKKQKKLGKGDEKDKDDNKEENDEKG